MARILLSMVVAALLAGCARETVTLRATDPPRPGSVRAQEASQPTVLSVWESAQTDAGGRVTIRLTLLSHSAFHLDTILQSHNTSAPPLTLSQRGRYTWSGNALALQTRSLLVNGAESPLPDAGEVPDRCYLDGSVMRVIRGSASIPLQRTR